MGISFFIHEILQCNNAKCSSLEWHEIIVSSFESFCQIRMIGDVSNPTNNMVSPNAQMCCLTTNYSQYLMHPKELSKFDVNYTCVWPQLNMAFYTIQPYVTCILMHLGVI